MILTFEQSEKKKKTLENIVEKEEMLVNSISFFLHNVSYVFKNQYHHVKNISVVFCPQYRQVVIFLYVVKG